MKILFAVNNDNVSEAIAKKYQNEYKEILSYKNVYYFNAIIRELQKDKTYSRIVISEDLEPFANNNYESIDKFLFDKYSHISEEAKNLNNENIDIILICADRRRKTDSMLPKLFKLNIFNAIIGQDRSINEVCRLINGPRDREEAKKYYAIQESELAQTEGEDSVSEAEVENIRAHYARLGRNEDKYVESFNNIVSQYTDTQLKIIIKYLPMNVKAVLEERSPKYQQLVTTSVMNGSNMKLKAERYKDRIGNQFDDEDEKSEKKGRDDVVEQFIKPRNIKSVVIPTNIKTDNVRKVTIPKVEKPDISIKDIEANPTAMDELQNEIVQPEPVKEPITMEAEEDIEEEKTERDSAEINQEISADAIESIKPEVVESEEDKLEEPIEQTIETTSIETSPIETTAIETGIVDGIAEEVVEQAQPKRGRGRPRKIVPVDEMQENKPKRGRGRPRKQPIEQEQPVTEELEEKSIDLENITGEVENSVTDITKNIVEEVKDEPEVIENDITENEVDLTEESEIESENNEDSKEVDLFSMDDDTDTENEGKEVNLFELDDTDEEPETVETTEISDDVSTETQEETQEEQEVNLFDIEEETEEQEEDLFNEKDDSELDTTTESNSDEEEIDLFNISNNDSPVNTIEKKIQDDNVRPESYEEEPSHNDMINTNYSSQDYTNPNFASLLTADKKIVVFVGTTKNGTSFIVNNTAEMLSSMGIDTAILDMTKSKNSYYIYTNNEERLRETARTCMNNLQNGRADGIRPHKNLAIYTEMPGEEKNYNIDTVLSTLVNNYSAILIDADFDTPEVIFERAQEIYLVQTMDVLTIQPLTAFLRNLKSKNILKQEKIRIVINKSERVRSLNIKTLIGGMANYNAPNMSYMTELFDKDHVRFCEIPFETENYVKYLEYLVVCSINLNGYTKQLLTALRELANSVYPLLNGRDNYQPYGRRGSKEPFTNEVNDTLNRMKSNY